MVKYIAFYSWSKREPTNLLGAYFSNPSHEKTFNTAVMHQMSNLVSTVYGQYSCIPEIFPFLKFLVHFLHTIQSFLFTT